MRSSHPRRASTWPTNWFSTSWRRRISTALRRRALPSSTGPFDLIRLLLSRARGPASPIPASPDTTTTTTRTTGVNIRNLRVDPKDAGATTAVPMSGALAATAGVAPSGVGARAAAAAAGAATTALRGGLPYSPQGGSGDCRGKKYGKITIARPRMNLRIFCRSLPFALSNHKE